jgi:hypothetical protein
VHEIVFAGGNSMLFELIITVIIILCGVAVYYALLGLMVLYNKKSAGKVNHPIQEPDDAPTEEKETAPAKLVQFKNRIRLEKPVQNIKEIDVPNILQQVKEIRLNFFPQHQKEPLSAQDPLRLEHKSREDEFRRKMQQKDEELLRELKQRREEKLLVPEQETNTEEQTEITAAIEMPATN